MAGKRGNPNLREVGKATRWKKGQSGNPGGARKGLSITRLVRDLLQQPAVDGSTATNADMVAAVIVNRAKAGDSIFTPLVWRYVDGDPKQAGEQALRELAEKIGPALGIDADELLTSFLADLGAA